ncbi:TPA: glycosyltransferase [Klebsiella pneumoniae]|nr:glycosyltransferase [Klebsiella pneumoniae]HCI9587401.1 glycosyltransferase [Klebsiella pneumoniae]
MLSIIIPLYNAELHVPNLLNNIKELDLETIEVILVNDGSNDSTELLILDFISSLQSTNVRLVNKNNGGVSSARNVGLNNISCDSLYLAFFDCDDWFYSDVLNSFLNDVKSLNDPDLILFNFISNNGNYSKINDHKLEGDVSLSNNFVMLYTSGLIQPCWNKIYKTKLIKENNLLFEEGINMGEDFRFNISFLEVSNNVAAFRSSLYQYNTDSANSLTKRYLPDSFEYFKYGISKVNDLCRLKGIDYPDIHNRYIIALKDRCRNLSVSTLPYKEINNLFEKDFTFVRNNLGKIDIKTLSFQNRIIYILVKFNLPKFIWLAFTFHRLMKL